MPTIFKKFSRPDQKDGGGWGERMGKNCKVRGSIPIRELYFLKIFWNRY